MDEFLDLSIQRNVLQLCRVTFICHRSSSVFYTHGCQEQAGILVFPQPRGCRGEMVPRYLPRWCPCWNQEAPSQYAPVQNLNGSRHGNLLTRDRVSTGVRVAKKRPEGRPLFQEPSHCWVAGPKLDSCESASHAVGGEQHLHTCRQARCSGKVCVGQPPHRRMLTHIDACAHRALAVHKILEGEGEVAALVEHPVRSIVRLDKPFAKPDKLFAE